MDTLYLIVVCFILYIFYYYKTHIVYNYWSNFNIPYLKDRRPIFGHVFLSVLGKKSLWTMFDEIYNKYENASMCGFYFMRKPALLVRDPELIKSVFLNDFSSFHQNGMEVDAKLDPVFAKNPFFSYGDQWRDSRHRLINHFTGKKLRYLTDIVKNVDDKAVDFVNGKVNESGEGVVEFELNEFFTRITGEVVANAAFGIEGNSFEDNPGPDSFTEIAKILFNPTSKMQFIGMILIFYEPKLASLLGMRFMPDNMKNFFNEALLKVIEDRKVKNLRPNDFLQFVVEANAENDKENILAEIAAFFTDVYLTSSLSLALMFYRLANNRDIQEKLREEVKRTLVAGNGKITYESLKSMDYLEQVLMETLRMNPPLNVFLKNCTEEITLRGSDGLSCTLKPGNMVALSTKHLHMDKNYWKKPEIFDPERFSAENRSVKENKFSFLPFGEGPRACPGRRMATMLIKMTTLYLLSNFVIEHSLSKNKLEMDTETPLPVMETIKDGIWARFKKLN